MRNGAGTCLVLSMSLLLSTSVSAQYESSKCPRECYCIQNGDKTEYSCSELQLIVQNDKTATLNCEGSTLDCTKLPSLNFVRGGQLNVLRVESCGVDTSLQCVLTRLNATSIRRLYLNQQQTPVTEETVKGLIGLESFWIFSSGVQKVVPVDSLKLLPALNMLRLSNVGLTDIPANTFYDVDRPMGQNLTFLDISLNNITSLQRDSFFGLPKLNNITIYKNNIRHVDVNTFEGVGGLLKLDFADESISTLPPGLFTHTPLLFYLSIPRNAVELRLDEGVISSLAHLKELIIKDALKLSLGHLALSHLPSLSALDISGSHITELPEDLLFNSTSLNSLDLSNNNLSFLPDKLFSGMKKLRELRLSNNKLENVSKELFESTTEIEEIYLDGNRIKSLPDALFSSSHLRVLSFARNLIENITKQTFQGSSSLTNLDLSHNRLSWDCRVTDGGHRLLISDVSVLNSLDRLEILDLSYNNIQSVCDDWLHVMISLRDLNMSNNSLDFISSIQLNFLSDNLVVNFENNNITTIANDVHGTLPIVDKNHIKQLKFKLGSNPFNCDCQLYHLLRSLDARTFELTDARCSQPRSLERVPLSHVARTLHSLTCAVNGSAGCQCLFRPSRGIIECTCDRIHHLILPRSTFDHIRVMKLKLLGSVELTGLPEYVRELDLSGLRLEYVPNVPRTVKVLDLRNNTLQVIPVDILDRNITLMLDNNSLLCDCSYIDNVRNLQKFQRNIRNYSDLLCSDGAIVKGKHPESLCDLYYAIWIGGSCIVAGIIIAVAIVLMYKFLPQVQVMLFNCGCRCIVQEEWLDSGKKYDIFLSYTMRAVEDQNFVLNILLPKLEELNYKVCEHTRDFEIGRSIPDQIYTSVANSKRTLFVISNTFIQNSVWVLEEFNATIVQGAKDRRNRAVIIVLGDVDVSKAPMAIKHHLDLNTYIKWDADDASFWKRLQAALPKKLTATEIKKRQNAVKAVKALGSGHDVVVNEDGRLVIATHLKNKVDTNAVLIPLVALAPN